MLYRFLRRKELFVALAIFVVMMLAAAVSVSAQGGNTLEMTTSEEGIPMLTDAAGMSLYTFSRDTFGGPSVCYDRCAEAWPPLLVEEGVTPTVGAGILGVVGTVSRDDGTIQVTYNGWPLYYWAQDAAPGDTTGHGVRDVWYLAHPATVMLGGNDELGEFLIGPGGRTLYIFTQDQEGRSNCFDECAFEWPPLLLQAGETALAAEGVLGALSTITRLDGSIQVTYNGMPLYFFHEDEDPGLANGQGAKEVWWVVPAEGSPVPTEEPAAEATEAMPEATEASGS